MIKDLIEQQNNSKNVYFARHLTAALKGMGIDPSPKVVATEFNLYCKSQSYKPHTVRKWLLGMTQPRTEILLLLAEWLHLEPQELLTEKQTYANLSNKVSFEFDFTDQEVISKYLAMTLKEKITVRLVIDAIAEKFR